MNPEPSCTRVAVLTPLAPAGIAVIQMLGPEAERICRRIFEPNRSRAGAGSTAPDRLRLGRLCDEGGLIDEALVAVRRDPVAGWAVEINTHGSVRVVQRTLAVLQRHGAVLVEPAAVATEAWPARNAIEREALGALASAKTRRAVRWIARQRRLLADELDRLCRMLASPAGSDAYPDTPVSPDPPACLAVRDVLDQWLERVGPARKLLEGAAVAVVGPANAGKSTLANRLAGQSRSIVADQAGTTRDWVAEPTAVQGVPITLIDTAGLRQADGPIEQEAIRRGLDRAERADVRLVVVDISCPLSATCLISLRRFLSAQPAILVLNKVDLQQVVTPQELKSRLSPDADDVAVVAVSARTGRGMVALEQALLDALGFADWDEHAPGVFTDRQRRAIEAAWRALPNQPDRARRHLCRCLLGDPATAGHPLDGSL